MRLTRRLFTVGVVLATLLGGLATTAGATESEHQINHGTEYCPQHGWTETGAGGIKFCRRNGASYSVTAAEAWNLYHEGTVYQAPGDTTRVPRQPSRNDSRWDEWAPHNGHFDHQTNTFTPCADAASCDDMYVQTKDGFLRRKRQGTDSNGDAVYHCYFNSSDGSLHNYGAC